MKKVVYVIIGLLLLSSCCTHRVTLSPYVFVYKRPAPLNIGALYIILKTNPQIYELNTILNCESTIGEWKKNKDTLFLIPKYTCYLRNKKMRMVEITEEDDKNISNIPQQYLMRNDSLIDITDYNIVLTGILEGLFDLNKSRDEYVRCKE